MVRVTVPRIVLPKEQPAKETMENGENGLDGKVVAITGGGRGIGRGIADHLAARGARIAIIDVDSTSAEAAAAAIQGARPYTCDITREDQVVPAFETIAADFGRLDVLVNNAGIFRDAQLVNAKGGQVRSKASAEEFDLVIDVCLRGAFLCAREAAARIIETGTDGGVIVNISSGAFRGNFGQTNYSAAKAGLVAMSRVWAKELGRHGIRSMVIAPGAIETDLLMSMPKDALEGMARQIPLRRIGRIENVARATAHIIENDYLTGSIVEVNGGMTV